MSTDDRGWFSPPADQSTTPPPDPPPPPPRPDPPQPRPRRPQPRPDLPLPRPRPRTSGPRPIRPDQQVWPPVRQSPVVESATQPMPAVPSAGPLPPRARHSLPPMEPPLVEALPVEPPPGAEPAASGDAPPPAAHPAVATPLPPRRRRPVLTALVAVSALVVGLGATTYDGYRAYLVRSDQDPAPREQVVRPGQSVTLKHITWKAGLKTLSQLPDGTKPAAGSSYVEITVVRTPVDKDGTVKTGSPNDVFLTDHRGRKWVGLLNSDTPEKMEIGKPYPLTGYARVPSPQANEVELQIRPSNYRSDIPTDKLFTTKTEPEDDVLRFQR